MCKMAAASTAEAPTGDSTSPVAVVCVGMAGEHCHTFYCELNKEELQRTFEVWRPHFRRLPEHLPDSEHSLISNATGTDSALTDV